jgi:hypothetical protein
MRKRSSLPSFSALSIATTVLALSAVTYIALIAVVMSYAAITIEFSQSVRNDQAAVAALESQYLSAVALVSNTDVSALGYAKPVAQVYVPGVRVTALR